MLLSDFLMLVRVVRSLYGAKVARELFEEGVGNYPVLSDIKVESLKKYLQ